MINEALLAKEMETEAQQHLTYRTLLDTATERLTAAGAEAAATKTGKLLTDYELQTAKLNSAINAIRRDETKTIAARYVERHSAIRRTQEQAAVSVDSAIKVIGAAIESANGRLFSNNLDRVFAQAMTPSVVDALLTGRIKYDDLCNGTEPEAAQAVYLGRHYPVIAGYIAGSKQRRSADDLQQMIDGIDARLSPAAYKAATSIIEIAPDLRIAGTRAVADIGRLTSDTIAQQIDNLRTRGAA
jgi:hypothetical protein